jgi:hypothetical protein
VVQFDSQKPAASSLEYSEGWLIIQPRFIDYTTLTVVGLLCIELSRVYFCCLVCIVLLCVCSAVLHAVVA